MSIYGSRAKAAFNSLGMRPLEILEGKEGSVRLEEVVDELREDDKVATASEPLVRKYFEVLNDKGAIEYDDTGVLFNAHNKSLHKNGYSTEEIETFVRSFEGKY